MKKFGLFKFLTFLGILAGEVCVGGLSLLTATSIEDYNNKKAQAGLITDDDSGNEGNKPTEDEDDDNNSMNQEFVSNIFECEDMSVFGGAMIGEQRGGETNNPHGGSFVSELNGKVNAGVIFSFTSDMDTIAQFYLCFGNRSDKALDLKATFNLTVNNMNVSLLAVTTKKSTAEVSYVGWEEYKIANIFVKKGTNSVKLETKSNASSNIDYIRIDTYANLKMVTEE